ncbi:hypothetical protein [Natronobacterium gregoryi]|nr:hypothetical protein [Natronobacterium gregoryi]
MDERPAVRGRDRLLVCHPSSGSGDHVPGVQSHAIGRGFEL